MILFRHTVTGSIYRHSNVCLAPFAWITIGNLRRGCKIRHMSLISKLLLQLLAAATAFVGVFAWGATADAGEGAAAEGAAEQGLAIFTEADRRESGFVDLTVELRMILRNASGKSSERALSIRQLEVPEDGDKLMVVFAAPASIRGTALLSHAHKVGSDDQWLFLPALNRVKKIASP